MGSTVPSFEEVGEVTSLQDVQTLDIGVVFEGIEVTPDGSGEQGDILADHCLSNGGEPGRPREVKVLAHDSAAQILQPDGRDVDSVDPE